MGCLTVVVAVERDNFVLDCEPLSQWVPNDLSVGLLVQDSVEEGTQVTESDPPSVWCPS